MNAQTSTNFIITLTLCSLHPTHAQLTNLLATSALHTTDPIQASTAYTAAIHALFDQLYDLAKAQLTPTDLATLNQQQADRLAEITSIINSRNQPTTHQTQE